MDERMEREGFSLLTEQGQPWAGMLAGVLEDAGIPFVSQDVHGAWLTAQLGELARRARFYVPRERLEEARELVEALFNAPEAE